MRRPERKQNWTVPHCGSVLPICLSLRPVGSIHTSCLAAREQTSAAQIAKASPPCNIYIIFYFYSFLALSFNSIFNFFLTEAAQYECSYRRTAHQATAKEKWTGREGRIRERETPPNANSYIRPCQRRLLLSAAVYPNGRQMAYTIARILSAHCLDTLRL